MSRWNSGETPERESEREKKEENNGKCKTLERSTEGSGALWARVVRRQATHTGQGPDHLQKLLAVAGVLRKKGSREGTSKMRPHPDQLRLPTPNDPKQLSLDQVLASVVEHGPQEAARE